MLRSLRAWLNNTALTDPVERRQAPLLQVVLLTLFCILLLAVPMLLVTATTTWRAVLDTVSSGMLALGAGIALVLLRRGYFRTAVFIAALGFMPGQIITLVTTGVDNSAIMFLFSIPITLVGLLSHRRDLVCITVICALTLIASAVLAPYAQTTFGFTPQRVPTNVTVTVLLLIFGLLAIFLERFSTAFREALETSRAREQELETIRASLETTVSDRTSQLQQALQDVRQREARLVQTLEELKASQAEVQELSAPIIPVLDGVLIAPLIGSINSERAAMLTENLLRSVEQTRAHHVIFDITGVPIVDTHVAQILIRTAEATRLLGAQALLVGVRPEVAQILVSLNITFGTIATYPTLLEAITMLQERAASRRSHIGSSRLALSKQ
jgi:rsbT co-antagonist protein RsbR